MHFTLNVVWIKKLTHYAPPKQNSDPADNYNCPPIIRVIMKLHSAHCKHYMHTWLTVRITWERGLKLTKAKGQTLRRHILCVHTQHNKHWLEAGGEQGVGLNKMWTF